MSIREFMTALPKAELNLQLTGALRKESLLLIANQNGIPAQWEDFTDWVDMIDQPDPERMDEIAKVLGSWIIYPEDIALVVYDIGVALSKQNIPYAEVAVNPSEFIGSARMNFDTFIDALNDGRDRARRAWNVELSWIFCIPRDNPRAGDDVARWASGSVGKRGNVVALGLIGPEDAQPVGQYRRAFATAQKKDLYRAVCADDKVDASGIGEALEELQPNRLVNSWAIADDDTLLDKAVNESVPLVNSIGRVLNSGDEENITASRLVRLQKRSAQLVLSCDRPSLYQSSLVDEYVLAHEKYGIALEELIQLARRSIELSLLDSERKETMLRNFDLIANSPQARFLDRNEAADSPASRSRQR